MSVSDLYIVDSHIGKKNALGEDLISHFADGQFNSLLKIFPYSHHQYNNWSRSQGMVDIHYGLMFVLQILYSIPYNEEKSQSTSTHTSQSYQSLHVGRLERNVILVGPKNVTSGIAAHHIDGEGDVDEYWERVDAECFGKSDTFHIDWL